MSRSFISLVERNLCRPSPASLALIAERLQKPVAYFREADCSTIPFDEVGLHLVNSAAEALATNRPELALEHARLAIRMLETLDDPMIEGRAWETLAECHQRLGNVEQAAVALETYVECCTRMGQKAAACSGYLKLGHLAFHMEEFAAAERHYKRALALADGLKTLSEDYAVALAYRASCLTRLGRDEEALDHYTKALAQMNPRTNERLWAMTALSLGWVNYKLNQPKQARHYTHLAREALCRMNPAEGILAEHNLAIFDMGENNVAQALPVLERCCEYYKAQKLVLKECSVREDIAKGYIKLGDLAKARAECEQAMALLDGQSASLPLGRLYVQVAEIDRLQGRHHLARQFLDLGIAVFRRLRAGDELERALTLRQDLVRERDDDRQ